MKTLLERAAVGVGVVACVWLAGGCEHHGSGNADVYGLWTGTAASGRVQTTLDLRPVASRDGRIGGSVQFGGDSREIVGGWFEDNDGVQITVEGGDVWHLTFSDGSMTGEAERWGGGSYALSFSREGDVEPGDPVEYSWESYDGDWRSYGGCIHEVHHMRVFATVSDEDGSLTIVEEPETGGGGTSHGPYPWQPDLSIALDFGSTGGLYVFTFRGSDQAIMENSRHEALLAR